MFDDIFGGLFDFNGDGETDLAEEVLGFAMLDELIDDEADDSDDWDFD